MTLGGEPDTSEVAHELVLTVRVDTEVDCRMLTERVDGGGQEQSAIACPEARA